MAEIAAKTKLAELNQVISKMKHIFWYNDASKAIGAAGALADPDIELPVLEDGANVDTGAVSLTYVKLTTGQNWTERSTREDPDISFQVASVAGAVNDLLSNKVEGKTVTATIGGKTMKGQGYSNDIKKVTGALLLTGEEGDGAIFFPNASMFAGFIGGDGDNPSYYNVLASFSSGSGGEDYYIMTPEEEGTM